MISGAHLVRVWACTKPIDMRLGFNGLTGLVASHFRQDILQGDAFLFVNARRTSAKVLWWDGTGLALYCKKLGKRQFPSLWKDADKATMMLSAEELSLFLRGAHVEGRVLLSSHFSQRVT